MIKEVKIKTNVVIVNKHHEQGYGNKEGVMIIEKDNGDKHILDLESNTDISKSDYLDIVDTKKTKEEAYKDRLKFEEELLPKRKEK